jgi:uncharacterized membrane protein
VHALVGEEAWQRIVSAFTASAKTGNLAEAFVAAIEACADLLAIHFPPPI